MSSLNKSSLAALALVGSLGLGASGAAHAGGGVAWSVAVGQPGFSVGVSSGPMVMPAYYPAPVVVAPRPVYVPAPPVYVPPRVVYAPAYPVYSAYPAYPAYRGWEHHHHGYPGYYGGGYERRGERFEERRGGGPGYGPSPRMGH